MIIKGEYVTEYYDNKLIGTTKYTTTKRSCDPSYKSPAKNPYFLVWHEGLCYEIECITEKYIELTYTSTGKAMSYLRKK